MSRKRQSIHGYKIKYWQGYTGGISLPTEDKHMPPNLPGFDLSGEDLSMANFGGGNLEGADLSYANLSGANLAGANLRGADLSYANLSSAFLRRANLQGANLTGANLGFASLESAKFTEANLCDTNMSGAYNPSTYVDEERFRDVIWNAGTIWSEHGFRWSN
jgi:uncharacterized protein YjbI with pentapeptide repeats